MPDQSDQFAVKPVGIAHTPYDTPSDAPHQGFADDAESELEVFEPYADAVAGLEEVHRVTVVYWAHRVDRPKSGSVDGVFARRGPDRPNPLSICTCLVLGVDGRSIRVRGLDAVDGSPLIDLKPALQAEV